MTRPIEFSTGEFYHLYNRGTDKRKIFLQPSDYKRFLALLYLCNTRETIHLSDYQGSTLTDIFNIIRKNTLVELSAYCLMPNYFHLLIQEKMEGGISLFMQKLSTGYTMYFNKKNDRTGSLFGGRFKAKHIDSDEYLKYILSYIHLNPIKIIEPTWKEDGIKNVRDAEKFLGSYNFSSYAEYTQRSRPESILIKTSNVPKYFDEKDSFKNTLKDWILYKNDF
ncbi:MAG: transposase [Parcubacteria group bacterium]|nr:transposase [Parcubacteria group bacterium]